MGKRIQTTRPRFIPPMLCAAVRKLPPRDGWFYEVKRKGCRTIAVKEGSNVTLFSRDGQTLQCREACETVRRLNVKSAVIDGELVAVGHNCNPQPWPATGRPFAVRLYAFDLLHLNSRDVMTEPVERRKERLCAIALDSQLLFSLPLDCDPASLIEEVRYLSFDGIIAKRKGSAYEPGKRTGTWLKMHVTPRLRQTPQTSIPVIG
jgi:bifunctional non-homologous end joining protein LigD